MLLSSALITVLAPVTINSPQDFIEHVVLARQGFLFELWLALGGVLVAPIFASTVITIPLLLDRQVSIRDAVATSWQVVLVNPITMALWGALIMLLTLLGFATVLLGLVLVVPLLGHASWHAYRDLLDVSATLPAACVAQRFTPTALSMLSSRRPASSTKGSCARSWASSGGSPSTIQSQRCPSGGATNTAARRPRHMWQPTCSRRRFLLTHQCSQWRCGLSMRPPAN